MPGYVGTATMPHRSPDLDSDSFEDLMNDLQISVQTPNATYYHNIQPPPRMESLYPNTPDLLSDFEVIDTGSSPNGANRLSAGRSPPVDVLVDISSDVDYDKLDDTRSSRSSARDQKVYLLQSVVKGIEVLMNEEWNARTIELNAGRIVKAMNNEKAMWVRGEYEKLYQTRRSNGEIVRDIVNEDHYATITANNVMRLNDDQALILLAVPLNLRVPLHADIERFNFIESLRIGEKVLVHIDKMPFQPAQLVWKGTRNDAVGTWFSVDFDDDRTSSQLHYPPFDFTDFDPHRMSDSRVAPSQRLFLAAHQIHKPDMKGGGVSAMHDNRVPVVYNDSRRSKTSSSSSSSSSTTRERIVPIQRKDDLEGVSPYDPHHSNARMSRRGPTNGYSDAPYPQGTLKQRDAYAPSMSSSSSHQKLTPPHSTSSEGPTPPSRSRSVHALSNRRSMSARNEPVCDDRANGARVGDSCIWNDRGRDERGEIRYIGYLKGHSAIYAGVEFRNPIGAGTGTFAGEELFKARDGHAGFVELGSLEIVPRPQRRRLSTSRAMPAAAGNAVSVPVTYKQASSESLSDPPPPYSPPTPPSPPRASSAASSHPPPLPTRPAMRVEDYLIDSFDIGSWVSVCHLGAQRSGVVRWLGDAMSDDGDRIERSAVVELDDEVPTAWRSSQNAPNYSGALHPRGVLVPATALRRNRTASSNNHVATYDSARNGSRGGARRADDFGSMDSGIEKSKCLPAKEIVPLVGRQKGIQGYCNSCYLDATLYAMFLQSTAFDFLLERAPKKDDHRLLAQFQKVLAQEVVYPLRRFHYVRADHMMRLRELLAELLPSIRGLTSEEKDPEEILGQLFANIFRAEPFIKLVGAKGQLDSQFLCPVVVDDWQGGAATTQHLLERHLRGAQLQLARVPPVLIMQLPRYGQQKVFDKILPLETIDITPFVAGAVPACSKCGGCADYYCPTCFLTRRVFFTDVVHCERCFFEEHAPIEIRDHQPRHLSPPPKPVKKPALHKMVLSAVLCIETSHYVAYVRSQSGKWLFFDSMADRQGLSDGFNVPVVRECENMSSWLSFAGWKRLSDADETGQVKALFGKGAIEPLVGRLLSDSYICFYEDVTQPSSTHSIISNVSNVFKRIKE